MSFVAQSLTFRERLRQFILGWFAPQVLKSEQLKRDLNVTLKKHWESDSIEVDELIREEWDEKNEDENFIVFIDPELDVDWISDKDVTKEMERAIGYAESIAARRCRHLRHEQIMEFRRVIGQAVVCGICEEFELSQKLADEAAAFLKARTVERSRSWTLSSAHVFLIVLSVGLVLLANSIDFPNAWKSEDLFYVLLAAQGGIVGAYLSVIQKAGSGQWDAAAGRWVHNVEVFTKIFAGGIFGAVAFLISRSSLSPAALKGIASDGFSAFILGLIAGFLERFIPKIISKYSNLEETQTDSKP